MLTDQLRCLVIELVIELLTVAGLDTGRLLADVNEDKLRVLFADHPGKSITSTGTIASTSKRGAPDCRSWLLLPKSCSCSLSSFDRCWVTKAVAARGRERRQAADALC